MGSSESELPDDIIHLIINKYLICDPTLTNKTAVQLSLVSKEFSRAVQRRRALTFEWDKDPSSKTKGLQELKYMISALNQDSHHLETFTIRAAQSVSPSDHFCRSIYDDHSCFDQCIERAAAKSRGLINLNMRLWYNYVLPQSVFQAESLVRLNLESCYIPAAESATTWLNLKRLRLKGLCIKAGMFESMIRGCPVIEILEFIYCRFRIPMFENYHIKVSNLRYLKQLDIEIHGNQTVEVDATPNLECLVYRQASGYLYEVDLGKREYRNLRSLTVLWPSTFSHDFFTDMEHQFPRLEELCIKDTNRRIKRISLSSSSLKKISLQDINGLEEATFDVPNILVFDFHGNVVPKLSFAGNSGGWTSRVTFKINNANIDTSLFLKLEQFLAAYAINRTSITVSFKEGVTEFHIVAHPPADFVSVLETIQRLTICRSRFLRAFCLSFASEIFDSIFLICRPRRITVQHWQGCEFPKLLYDYLLGSKRFSDHQSTWNLTKIDVHRQETEIWSGSRLDRDKFLELFKPEANKQYLKPMFNVGFELEY